MDSPAPRTVGAIGLRAIRANDGKALQQLLTENRAWLQPWEATYPGGGGAVPGTVPLRPVIRQMLRQQRAGQSVPFVMTFHDEVVGQLTVSDISGGALRSASIGYWISQHVAGKGITPTAVALAVDACFQVLRLHRIEICIRPENSASLRVVEKLGMRFEGLRARYIYIDGAWCDHNSYAVTVEDVPEGMLARLHRRTDTGAATV
ncbi:MAG: GNAT family N-acetyltransferase [Actinobacteria bacterium]|nr:GNAT family N-acetyltransferase [Actinomycetota bacterium]